jgi:hypothetical protein
MEPTTKRIRRTKRSELEPKDSIRIGSVRTFLDALEKLNRSDEAVLFYRGHSSFSYNLKPSIYRNKGWIENEHIIFKELILRCPTDFDPSESTFQTLVKMQHYSLPTRLLDITTNPLVALFFACDNPNSAEAGEVVTFRIPKAEIKYFDSDTVSVISNISRRPNEFTVPPENLSLERFNLNQNISYLLHEIKKEKPYFEPKILRIHLQSVVCVKPKLNNARIIRQDGAFLLFGVGASKLDCAQVPERYKTQNSLRILITDKLKVKEQLEALGITKGTIYPEIESVAGHIKETYSRI